MSNWLMWFIGIELVSIAVIAMEVTVSGRAGNRSVKKEPAKAVAIDMGGGGPNEDHDVLLPATENSNRSRPGIVG